MRHDPDSSTNGGRAVHRTPASDPGAPGSAALQPAAGHRGRPALAKRIAWFLVVGVLGVLGGVLLDRSLLFPSRSVSPPGRPGGGGGEGGRGFSIKVKDGSAENDPTDVGPHGRAKGSRDSWQRADAADPDRSPPTARVERRVLRHRLDMAGVVEPDLRAVRPLVAPCRGRISWDRMPAPGMPLRVGEVVLALVSPERLAAETAFTAALATLRTHASETDREGRRDSELEVERAEDRLLALGCDEASVAGLRAGALPRGLVPVEAPCAGSIRRLRVQVGDDVAPGQTIATVWDGRRFWVRASVPSNAMHWLDVGLLVRLESTGGWEATGRVAAVGPGAVLESGSPAAGTARSGSLSSVLVAFDGREGRRPGDAVRGVVERIVLADGGLAPAAGDTAYRCAHHPDVVGDAPTVCPFCRESLIHESEPVIDRKAPLSIPLSACRARSGGSWVLVMVGDGAGEPRPIVTGEVVGERVVVVAGLDEGETVVLKP